MHSLLNYLSRAASSPILFRSQQEKKHLNAQEKNFGSGDLRIRPTEHNAGLSRVWTDLVFFFFWWVIPSIKNDYVS